MIPGYSLNKSADDVQKKNTFVPYLTKFTTKALQPVDDVRNGVYDGLGRKGTAIPADFANQRAGDPNYTETHLKQVLDYINNPDNGWVKQNDGTYKNPTTGGTYDPDKARSSAFDPVAYTAQKTPFSRYIQSSRKAKIPSKESDKYYRVLRASRAADSSYLNMFMEKPSDPISPSISSFDEPAAIPMTRNQIFKYSPSAETASHEFNHGYTDNIVTAGLIRPFSSIPGNKGYSNTDRFITMNYAKSVPELINAASLFQQQHYRNTGRRIIDKNKFWEDFNNAKKNIQDYDPESRRFMQSIDILQNEAPNDPEAAYMLDQIIEVMPLITNRRKYTIPGYTYNPTVVG